MEEALLVYFSIGSSEARELLMAYACLTPELPNTEVL